MRFLPSLDLVTEQTEADEGADLGPPILSTRESWVAHFVPVGISRALLASRHLLKMVNKCPGGELGRIMASKKPPPVFEVHFEGEELYPEQIPLRTLSDALSAIQRLVSGSDIANEEDAEEEERENEVDSLRLLEVKRGSAVYKVAGPPPSSTWKNLRILGRILEDPENVDAEHDYLLSPVERLSAVARRLCCSIALREPGKKKALGSVLARIEPVSYESISKTLLVQGDTSISGKVVRVGG